MITKVSGIAPHARGDVQQRQLRQGHRGGAGRWRRHGYSGSTGSNEVITLMAPAAGTYRVCVAGYAPDGGSATYTLALWVVTSTEVGGNLKVSLPGSVFIGGTASAVASWSALAPGQRYLGAVRYLMGTTPVATTMLEVDATDPVPLPSPQPRVAAAGVQASAMRD